MPGEVLAIVGKNGAGKSTLIKCMNRILEPEKGVVFLGERDLKIMQRKDIAKSMAYLSQKASYTFPITVFDAVLSGRYPHRAWNSDKEDEIKVSEVLKILELESLSMRYFNEISGGQQQQVLIARALVQEAAIFLFDEPTSDLDIKHQLEVMETVRKIVREKKVSAVVTIHDLNLAARYADRLIMLKNGLIFAAGSAASVLTEENITQAYGVRVLINQIEGKPHIIPMRPIDPERRSENNV
ncbi:MAG: ABC transporter ATP-binding protein [Candidatus Omnitrophica bacterium]|nr:ABC transporter ATP-binding protein [Candidatus Omnitrophota bacterium]